MYLVFLQEESNPFIFRVTETLSQEFTQFGKEPAKRRIVVCPSLRAAQFS
jgi:hypothetical protein